MAQSVTLSSAGTATIILNPTAKATTVMFSASAGSSGGFGAVEFSLDDPTILNGPTATWALLSSAFGQTSSTYTSAVFTVLSPIGAVRINSSGVGNGTLTLKALQSITA